MTLVSFWGLKKRGNKTHFFQGKIATAKETTSEPCELIIMTSKCSCVTVETLEKFPGCIRNILNLILGDLERLFLAVKNSENHDGKLQNLP